ncbi:beta-ketoacyl-ACP synthase III [Nakamurella endophytica]|uniref:3-oxoacyl-[acyl-carrier-protein] synthase 3 n=1 Tax=Nakamurella endophytica TaxID=1748367 RepID=A0A917WI90_9ACTN|nr:beta-ketoacyl-ACP synthase III [Nakamurella endophytica]GGM06139.1 3-oxoacyl-[acyl-carrier-protein] synthase 3 [Nakamurella endophytica]
MSGAVIRPAQGAPGARVAGLGHYRPDRVVTNDDLAQTLDTNDEWVRTRVGIQERRFAGPDESVVSMGAIAAAKAMAEAGVTAADVDAVIVATCTLPTQIPHAATQIAGRLGIHAPGSFDVNAACAGFCYGLEVAAQAVRSGAATTVLLVGSEKLTDWVDPTDRANAIIFADGAGAVVVTGADTEGVGPVAWGSAEDLTETINIPDRASFIHQEGQSVFRWATTAIAPVAERAVRMAGLELADVDVLVTHQANLRIVDAIARKLVSAGARDDLRVARDIVTTGNTSSASIPVALDRMRAAGEVASGEVVLAIGFGAGLTYAGQVFRCP